jgi:Glycosyltransferase family 87
MLQVGGIMPDIGNGTRMQGKAAGLEFIVTRSLGIATVCLVLLTNLLRPLTRDGADFPLMFYTAGKLATLGQLAGLYPPLDSTNFATSLLNRTAHSLYPEVPLTSVAAFHYMPLVAFAFAPLAVLQPAVAFLLWQVLSLCALAFCSRMIGSGFGFGFGSGSAWAIGTKWSRLFWLSFAFFPIFHTISIGQLGLLFGLVPMTVAFVLIGQRKYVAAGLVWSLLILKPQYAIVGLFAALMLAVRRQCKPLLAMIAGMASILLLSIAISGTGTMQAFLHNLKLSQVVFLDQGLDKPAINLCSSIYQPVMALAAAPARSTINFTEFALISLIGMYFLYRYWQKYRQQDSLDKLDAPSADDELKTALSAAIIAMPVIEPYLLFYDLSLLILPIWLVWTGFAPSIKKLLMAMVVLINFYFVAFYFPPALPVWSSLLFSSLLSVLSFCVVMQLTSKQ